MLREITQAVVDSRDLSDDTREDVLEHLALLGDEANKPAAERRRAPARNVLRAIGDGLANANALMDLWLRVEPVLRQAFGLG